MIIIKYLQEIYFGMVFFIKMLYKHKFLVIESGVN